MDIGMIFVGIAIIFGVYFFFVVLPIVISEEEDKRAPEVYYTGVIDKVEMYPIAPGYASHLYQCYVKITTDDGQIKAFECTEEIGKKLCDLISKRCEFMTKNKRIKSYKEL